MGFTQNSGRNITFVNNTAFNNGNYAFLGHDSVTFQNNLAIGGTLMLTGSRQQNNSWNLDIRDARLVSTDPSHPEFLSLRADSPALDRGNNVLGRQFDQRGPGFPRVKGPAPDIGAYER